MLQMLTQVVLGVASASFIFGLLTALRRLLYHPLSSFPGPKLAAISHLYAAYYDLVVPGGTVDQLEVLHRKYGPVVRIQPNQLHFSDPRAFDDIYSIGSKFTKEPCFYDAFNERRSSFGFIDVKKAKQRKDVMRPLFSRRAILQLEHVIQSAVDQFVTALLVQSQNGKPVNIRNGFLSTSMEVILSYCFARSYGILSAPKFEHPTLLALEASGTIFFVVQHFPFLASFVHKMPPWLAEFLSPGSLAYGKLMGGLTRQIDELLADSSILEEADHEIIYHHLINKFSPDGSPAPSRESLIDEASVMIAAGTDTVGNTCALGTFHVLSNPRAYKNLVDELREYWPDRDMKMGYEQLEKLPYLTAVIKESLRMSHGVVSPLPRVVPTSTSIAASTVPPNTIVSMGATFMHYNSVVFPDPLEFRPERWLDPGKAREIESFLVPFSKGPRSCLGINLAWCELYLIFANVFRKVTMEVYNTSVEDFKFMALLTPKYRGKPFHVKAKERLD